MPNPNNPIDQPLELLTGGIEKHIDPVIIGDLYDVQYPEAIKLVEMASKEAAEAVVSLVSSIQHKAYSNGTIDAYNRGVIINYELS